MAYEFSDANFQKEVIENEQLTVIDLWAEWSGPSKLMTPIVEELSTEFEGRAVIGRLNVDDNPEVSMHFRVRGLPTFLIFKNGELKDRITGVQTKQFLNYRIEAHI